MARDNHEIKERVSLLEALIGTAPDGDIADYNRMEKIAYLETSIEEIHGVVYPSAEHGRDHPEIKVPEPKSYGGARSAKELENFLWDMEQYFLATRVSKTEKVAISSMYLGGDAKLWWRTRMVDDADAGREQIDTWARLKELKAQFLPGNVSWIARDGLKRFKQKGSVRDYVKEFTSLMLDISNMSEEDKLYNFLYADALVDFQSNKESLEASMPSKFMKNHKGKEAEWKDSAKHRWNGKKNHSATQENDNLKNKGCFLCNEPHLARECPKRGKLSVFLAQENDEGREQEVATLVNPL
ncbi:hypothetical protein ZIOFF_021666 [Zingiber officinale]|uniref:Retrotransposon gag domain-containing protein n=1 Tax=Zingiber officinale TaxID=94328 RepID=A0A8J5HC38_ZINOF|nr:hypothetical protein ZIOFF_021666 [Zingiber officinale]